MRVAFVTNSAAGSSSKTDRDELLAALRRLGDVEVVEPASQASFPDDVRRGAAERDLVVIGGGDGTINCTLDALRDELEQHVLGLIPMGTGNDLARTLDIPRDPPAAAEALADARETTLDVGRIEGAAGDRLFLNACMGGFPVQVNEALEGGEKERLGPLAFVWGGIKALTEVERATVVVNGRRIDNCFAVGIGNGRTCGGGVPVWPDADPGDGLFDVCALSAESLPELLALGARVRLGKHTEADGVWLSRSDNVRVETEPSIGFNVDGELLGHETPVTFAHAGHVRFALPR